MTPRLPDAQQRKARGQAPAMTFQWRRCPMHPSLVLSVIVVADAEPWCVGYPSDDDPIAGHWLGEAAA